VISEPAELAEALAEVSLGSRHVHQVPVSGSPGGFLVVQAQPRHLLAEWQAARELVPVTGRWPLMTTSWAPSPAPGEILVGPGRKFRGSAGAAQKLAELRRKRARLMLVAPDELEGWLEDTRRLYGAAPDFAELQAVWEQDTTAEAVDRWLFAWEERHRPTSEPWPGRYLEWYAPDDDDCFLVFVPSAVPAESVGFFSFHGAADFADDFPAIVHSWYERYAALPVAHWGTMLQFIVERPPQTLDEAWELAAEQFAVAYDSFGSPPRPLRAAARALWRRPTWFLHDRPVPT
jgi:hypothetical protein